MFSLQPSHLELAPATIILLIILAAMLQDDLTCTTVGLFAFSGKLSIPAAWCACFVGTLLGDLIWFMLARWCGSRLLSTRPVRRIITPAQQETAAVFVDRYGTLSIFLCRFLPGVRTALQLVIGTLHKNFPRAVMVFALAAFLYTLLIFGLCLGFRNTMDVLGVYEEYGQTAMLFAAVAVLSVIWVVKRTIGSISGRRSEGRSASQQNVPPDHQY